MGEKIIVGPVGKGLRTDILPFNIDNDAFPVLLNAYQWRGRIKRKRGTQLLNRLSRYFSSTNISYNSGTTTITLDGTGSGNLLFNASWSLETNSALVPGSITITDTSNADETYTDPAANGILVGSTGGTGTVNYATGAFTITGGAGHVVSATFNYYPVLPVLGLRDFINASSSINAAQYPGTLAFDQTYSYNIITTALTTGQGLFPVYDVSFYKNPPSATYPGYVAKTNVTPTTCNGNNYQQFWSTNYQGAFWVTNGVPVPFSPANIGMQFAPASTITFVSQTATTITLTITNCPLVIGDFVFMNEWGASTSTNASTLNFQTGYVTACAPNTPPLATKTVTITFPNAALATDTYTPGIVQYLTTRVNTTIDCLRWYDGDPTNGSSTAPVLNGNKGWVNFAPPLSKGVFGLSADLPPAQYYLVGARMIYQFKDRLIFFAPVVQTSSANSQIYLQDTIIYSQNGTPYYTASFQGDPSFATTIYTPILVPTNQTATASAYFEDQTGFGGSITAGVDQEILTMGPNEDVLIVGFTRLQTRLIYSGNDVVPFNFFIINSELGSGSTFSAITMDKGIMTRGSRGYIITAQTESRRFDLDIPDQLFQINLTNNGTERVTAQRDYVNEWIYFTYPSNMVSYVFPNQTLQYNYRDATWAIFNECYTTYGTFRETTGLIWATVGGRFPTWQQWNQPWNSGSSTARVPKVIGGNTQGFVLIRDIGTGEAISIYIQNIVGTTVTSPNHCLNNGDYIVISGCQGTIGTYVNGNIYSVQGATTNTFILNGPAPTLPPNTATYTGGGVIQRMYVPFIQSKQFPVSWGMGRKTRLGFQQYLLTTTASGQITLLIYLSQDGNDPWNQSTIIPAQDSVNNTLIYSTVLFTSPELYTQNCNNLTLGNIGNGLNLLFAFQYALIFNLVNAPFVPGSLFISVGIGGSFATFTDNGMGGFTITGFGVGVGSTINYMTNVVTLQFSVPPVNQPTLTNFAYYVNNIQSPTASAQQQTWHRMNTSLLGDTVQIAFTMSDTQMRDQAFPNQFAEIEIHGMVLDVQPSQWLA
jgi:hypothetical protein